MRGIKSWWSSRWWGVWTSGEEDWFRTQKFGYGVTQGSRSVFVRVLCLFGVGKEWLGVLLRLHHIMIDDTASGHVSEG